ncbi:MAG: hypothetical protein QXG12_07325, partial [Thermoproteota archaeon]
SHTSATSATCATIPPALKSLAYVPEPEGGGSGTSDTSMEQASSRMILEYQDRPQEPPQYSPFSPPFNLGHFPCEDEKEWHAIHEEASKATEEQISRLKRLHESLGLEFDEESARSLSVYEASLLIARLTDRLRNKEGLRSEE